MVINNSGVQGEWGDWSQGQLHSAKGHVLPGTLSSYVGMMEAQVERGEWGYAYFCFLAQVPQAWLKAVNGFSLLLGTASYSQTSPYTPAILTLFLFLEQAPLHDFAMAISSALSAPHPAFWWFGSVPFFRFQHKCLLFRAGFLQHTSNLGKLFLHTMVLYSLCVHTSLFPECDLHEGKLWLFSL